MAKLKLHAGDYGQGQGSVVLNNIRMPWRPGDGFSLGKSYGISDIEELEVASEESVKRLGGTVGWGAAGALILGPVGLLAGLLAGGRTKEVTFVARFKDGKRILATTDSATYTRLMAATFR